MQLGPQLLQMADAAGVPMLLPLLLSMSCGYLLPVLLMKLQQPLLLLFLPLLLSPPLARAGRQHLHEIHKGKSAVPLTNCGTQEGVRLGYRMEIQVWQ